MKKDYKIINKIDNEILSYSNEIERGFALDIILEESQFFYEWVDYVIKHIGNDIIIDYKKIMKVNCKD